MANWVRLWEDMPSDPKWRTIARRSNQSVGNVIAVFCFLMVSAGRNAMQRGATQGFDAEDVATALDIETAAVAAILDAMQGKVLEGDHLTGWEERQPKREDSSVTERSRLRRERLRAEAQRNATQCNADAPIGNAPDADADADSDADSEGAKAPCSKTAATDTLKAFSLWNKAAAAQGWPTVAKLTEARRDKLRSRLTEIGDAGWANAIAKARASPLLTEDQPSWFNFDWLTKNPENILKLAEGNYDKRHNDAGKRQSGWTRSRTDPLDSFR